jgi:UDP-N-acetylmuramoyl-tripeptide--D-alanyl-D-alanine ligase
VLPVEVERTPDAQGTGAKGAKGAARSLPWLRPAAVAAACGGTLLRSGRGATGVSTDSRAICRGGLFVALRGEQFDGHRFLAEALARGAAGVVIGGEAPAPAGPGFVVRVPDTGEALLALARRHREGRTARVIGITGSCGKTSTKDILVHVLSAKLPVIGSPRSFNNAVGVPLTLFMIGGRTEAAVVEIGTSGPGEIRRLARSACPDGVIVTNVFESHLERLGSIEGVAREKGDLLEALPASGFAILNGDNPFVAAMRERTRARCIQVSVEGPGDVTATDVRFNCLGTSFLLNGSLPVTIPRLGSHNVANALCAIAAARELGFSLEEAAEALSGLPATDRRFEPRRCGDVTVYDDSYNMNPGSARAALLAFRGVSGSGRRVVVFGDMLELGQQAEELHRAVGCEVARGEFDHFVAVGARAAALEYGAISCGFAPGKVTAVPTRAAAVAFLVAFLEPGDRVLVKASRGLQLDLLVEELDRQLAVRSRPHGAGAAGETGA